MKLIYLSLFAVLLAACAKAEQSRVFPFQARTKKSSRPTNDEICLEDGVKVECHMFYDHCSQYPLYKECKKHFCNPSYYMATRCNY